MLASRPSTKLIRMMIRNIQKLEGKRQTKDIYFLILEREKKLLCCGRTKGERLEPWVYTGMRKKFVERTLEWVGNGPRDEEIILETSARYSLGILWKCPVNMWITLLLVSVVKLVLLWMRHTMQTGLPGARMFKCAPSPKLPSCIPIYRKTNVNEAQLIRIFLANLTFLFPANS